MSYETSNQAVFLILFLVIQMHLLFTIRSTLTAPMTQSPKMKMATVMKQNGVIVTVQTRGAIQATVLTISLMGGTTIRMTMSIIQRTASSVCLEMSETRTVTSKSARAA